MLQWADSIHLIILNKRSQEDSSSSARVGSCVIASEVEVFWTEGCVALGEQ